jgi:DNA-binding phage protein
MNPHLGSTLDDLLRQDFALDLVEARAQKRVLVRQLERIMRRQRLTKVTLAARRRTSRRALDRLLDPTHAYVTLDTMTAVAHALGTRLDLHLYRPRRALVRAGARPAPVATAVRERRT